LKRERELEAAALVAAFLDGIPMACDGRKAAPGTHDFDIVRPANTIALEVTTSADPTVLQASARMSSGPLTQTPGLTQLWALTVDHPRDAGSVPDFKLIREAAGALLVELESLGCGEVGRPLSPTYRLTGRVRDVATELQAMGVTSAKALGRPLEGPAWFAVSMVGGGGWADPDALNHAVEKECLSNAAKLAAARRSESHLFLWMDSSNFGAEFAMFVNTPPVNPPNLPAQISAVWLGSWDPGKSEGSNCSRFWRGSSLEWEILPVPDVRSSSRRSRRQVAR
jgi:hypothetical protein